MAKTTNEILFDILKEYREKSKQTNAETKDDYTVNGLLYCGKCKTPKEGIVDWLGSKCLVRVMCSCAQKEYEEKRRRDEQAQKDLEARNRRGACFDSVKMWNWTFENCNIKDSSLYKTAKAYADNFDEMKEEPMGLTFFGTVGTGKTYLAACIANAVIDKGYTCRMTTFDIIDADLSEMRSGKREYMEELKECDLLIIDDLAAERDTEYMQSKVYTVINQRYLAQKPIIVTTNLEKKQLVNTKDPQKGRILSRLLEMTVPVGFSGSDIRIGELNKNYIKYKDLLNLPGKGE